MASAPNVGDPAPDFTLKDDHGGDVTLSSLRGHSVVLFFYPKDDTPGCTKEACGFRDAKDRYDRAGVRVFGISADDVASHQAFRGKFSLNFPLLADPTHAVCDAYGVWGQTPWGEGIKRTTFIVGPDGRISHVYPKVDVGVHATEILAALGHAPS